jgi:3'-phosphoadenosine 5'-phosphosulfate (PAPS) 3'-phosphatase
VESGSIGLKICLVAQGVADLFVKDVVVRDWDVAPPALILHEAGGCLRRFDGQEFRFEGDFEKTGVIAAGSERLFTAVTAIATSAREKS